jgi:hypothetical protein
METPFKIAHLISKSYTENLTPQEKEEEELNKWLETDQNNKILAKNILKEKNLENSFDQFKQYNVKSELKEFNQKLSDKKPKTILFSTVLKYAAVIILPIALAAYLYFMGIPDSLLSTEQIAINPGTSKAQLFTSSNQVYNLEKDSIIKINDELIKIESRGKSLIYSKSIVPPEILKKEEIHRLIVPRGGEYYVELSDGTKMWINSESEVKYPKQFVGKIRHVEIITGEVYFEVAHNAEHPFLVKSKKGIVNVLGTSFNVRAYDDEINNVTTLVDGSVSIRHRFDENSTKKLVPGEQASIKSVNHRIKVDQVKTSYYTAWKDNRFEFNKEPLDYIMKNISRWYNVDISFNDNEIKKFLFSARLDKYENIEKLLEKIELTKKVKIEITKKGLSISKYND